MLATRLKLAIFAATILALASAVPAENIDPNEDGSQYAYGENVGWINFEPNVAGPNVGATASDDKLTGFIWAENIGWIKTVEVDFETFCYIARELMCVQDTKDQPT